MDLRAGGRVTDENIENICPIKFSEIDPGVSLENRVVKGIVSYKGPISTAKDRKLIKLMIKEASTDCQIPVYIIGEYTKTVSAATIGDLLLLSNAFVESYTGNTDGIKCQLLVEPNRPEPIIKVIKQTMSLSKATIISSFDTPSTSNVESKNMTKNKQTTARKYMYTKLNDVKIRSTVNVYGVVKFFKPPYKSRGTDYLMILSLIDPSFPDDDDKLKCSLFNKDLNQFPAIKKVGDIVRFHRVQVTEYKGQPQGNGGPGFAWLVFGGNTTDSINPRAAFPENYSFSDDDKQQVNLLRTWRNKELDLSQDECTRISTLSSVTCNKYFDLTCQVIATCLLKHNSMLLRIWDGTKVHLEVMKEEVECTSDELRVVDDELVRRARSYMYDVKVFDDHVEKALTIQAGDFIHLRNLHAAKFKPVGNLNTTENNVLPTIEFCLHQGKIYNRGLDIMSQDDEDVKRLKRILEEIPDPPDEEQPNVEATTSKSITSLDDLFVPSGPAEQQPSTSKKHLQAENMITPKRTRDNPQNPVSTDSQQSKISQLNSEASDRRCMQTSATIITDHHHIKTCDIRHVNKGKVPNKYRIRAKVVDMQPKTDRIEEFLRLHCTACHYVNTVARMKNFEPLRVINSIKYYNCPQCHKDKENTSHDSGGQQLEYIYMLQLILRDNTGWLMTQLWKEEALKFFDNREPKRLLKDKGEFQKLHNYLRFLLGNNNTQQTTDETPNKPWVECCIKSYSTEVGVCYQIFDTVMCEDEEYSQI